ncbi:MarR family winged helix-turn-helix transcriptional regulator [Actinoplanes friuliensis]|uniref:Transcriptional regulator TrmB n=1 Tax=Actinoplanes friuliensis DSM 7358 TaxID=1246995 RepID=U5VVQ5_9ACTN|nr:MarR family transcriptional regulator [Actinoplanes friuliensis]AGZ39726.1 transcriptional regulator TrmB [Actinoplanes friuliensis DSM 7358]
MSTSDFRTQREAEIVEATRRMIAAAVLFSHKVAEQLKLGPSDAQFMTLLDVHGPLTPGRLSDLTGLKTGTVTGVLDRLESAGYVRRDRDPHDRRKVIVSLDPAQIAARVDPHYAGQAEHMTGLLQRYSDDQLALIADFMSTMSAEQAP